MGQSECLCGFTRCEKYGCLVKQPYHLVEKVCFFKKSACSQSLSPLGHSDGFASCKAWRVLISASLPKTPFPGKGAILLGLPPLDQARMLAVSHTKPLHDAVGQMADDLYGGYAPATPFLSTIEVFRQSVLYVLTLIAI